MYTHKTPRLFLASLLLISIGFSSFIVSSLQVQAESTPTVILSPTLTAKLDAFIVKVQALRSKYPSDTDWNTFLTNLNTKIGALKPKYTGNALILAVLDRLSSGVNGLKNTATSATSPNDVDLCAQEGLDNIDETNFSVARNIVKREGAWWGDDDGRTYAYKMGQWQSYSFPINTTQPYSQSSYDYYLDSFPHVFNISEKKCDFVNIKQIEWYDASNCAGYGISGAELRITINEKFSDPNYKPTDIESRSCRLLPGKKYYLNTRWLRKSDLVDTSGKLRTDPNPLFSYYRKNFLSFSTTDFNKYIDGNFNGYGDSCLNGYGGRACIIDYNFDDCFFPLMPKR